MHINYEKHLDAESEDDFQINEDYEIWRKNSPLLYDFLIKNKL